MMKSSWGGYGTYGTTRPRDHGTTGPWDHGVACSSVPCSVVEVGFLNFFFFHENIVRFLGGNSLHLHYLGQFK